MPLVAASALGAAPASPTVKAEESPHRKVAHYAWALLLARIYPTMTGNTLRILVVARTAAFTVLVLTQLFNCFNTLGHRIRVPRGVLEPLAVGRSGPVGGAAIGGHAPAISQPRLLNRAVLGGQVGRV